MLQRLLSLFVLILLLPLCMWSYDGHVALSDSEPGVKISDYSDQAVSLRLDIPGVYFNQVVAEQKLFAHLRVPGQSVYGAIGTPDLPTFYKLVVIPEGARYTVSVHTGKMETIDLVAETGADYVYPIQAPISKEKNTKKPVFAMAPEAYKNAISGQDMLIVGEVIRARGLRLLPITLRPVAYRPQSASVDVYTRMDVTISLTGADLTQTRRSLAAGASAYRRIYEKTALGVEQLATLAGGKGFEQENMLVITADNLHAGLSGFVSWKEKKGYRVTLTKQSDIPNGTTRDGIKAYIQNAYNTWDPKPAWVILVGDTDTIPTYNGNNSYSEADVYYAYLDGGDSFPDVSLSRICLRTTGELNTYLDKLFNNEQYLNTDVEWMDDTSLLAINEQIQYGEGAHNYAADTYFYPNDWEVEKLYERLGSNKADAIASMNSGAMISNYTGHCNSSVWGFGSGIYANDVNGLTNQNMYFWAIGHCCSSNEFANSECIGETWIRAENGAIAYFGASNSSSWAEDYYLAVYTYEGLFDQELYEAAAAADYGKVKLWQHYNGNSSARYYMDMYNTLGDGSTWIMTRRPAEMSVQNPGSIAPGSQTFPVIVTSSGDPVADALVSAYGPDINIRGTAKTDANGQATITLDQAAVQEGSFTLHVARANYINVEKTMTVGSGSTDLVPIYRFFNSHTGTHFYTISDYERDYLIANVPHYHYEGPKFKVYKGMVSDSVPVYRFFNSDKGFHFYTISDTEKDYIINNLPNYTYEGIKFYVYSLQAHPGQAIPVYRFFNTQTGAHLYTISQAERDYIQNNLPQYTYEGEKFYAMPLGS